MHSQHLPKRHACFLRLALVAAACSLALVAFSPSAPSAFAASSQEAGGGLSTAEMARDAAPVSAMASSGKVDVKAKVVAQGAANIVRSMEVKGSRYLLLPSYAKLGALRIYNANTGKRLFASTSKNGKYVAVSSKKPIDIRQCRRDSSGARVLYVKSGKTSKPFVLKVKKSANIRTLYLKSKDPSHKGRAYVESSPSHNAKASGFMTLVTADGSVAYNGKLKEVKGRGNSTWRAARKKPYQIKLPEKASLLDGTDENAAKTWVLLANAFDSTYSRNYIAYKTAAAIGMAEAPDCEFVDLYYDGVYRGDYLLSEKVQVDDARVAVAEQENKSTDKKDIEKHRTAKSYNKYGKQFQYVTGVKAPKNITGGYLIELDNANYRKERSWFRTSRGVFVLKSPEDASKAQVKYISEYVQRALGELSANKRPKHVDLASLAKVPLVNELAKNPDYLRFSSTYFYKDKNENVLHAGPVWDFDLAFGVHGYQNGHDYISPKGYASRGYSNYFTKNRYFKKAYKRIFKTVFLTQAKGLVGKTKKASTPTIGSVRKTIAKSVAMEHTFHHTEGYAWVNKRQGALKASMGYTKRWLDTRISWMRREILR